MACGEYIPRKYKLLRDLPGIPAGSILTQIAPFGFFYPDGDTSDGFPEQKMKQHKDWFAPLDNSWCPTNGEKFYSVSAFGKICNMTWHDNSDCELRYEYGNVFKEEWQASEASEAVRELLELFQKKFK